LFNTQLLHVLMEIINPCNHIFSMEIQRLCEFILVYSDLSILKVKLTSDFLCSNLTIALPVLFSFCLPFIHKLFVFMHFADCILTLLLLDAPKHIFLRQVIFISVLFKTGSSDLILKKFVFNQL